MIGKSKRWRDEKYESDKKKYKKKNIFISIKKWTVINKQYRFYKITIILVLHKEKCN